MTLLSFLVTMVMLVPMLVLVLLLLMVMSVPMSVSVTLTVSMSVSVSVSMAMFVSMSWALATGSSMSRVSLVTSVGTVGLRRTDGWWDRAWRILWVSPGHLPRMTRVTRIVAS